MQVPCNMTRIGTALILAAAALAPARAEQDILRPEQAFRYETVAAENVVRVRWTIEPSHYLYRERMSFASRTAGIELGEAVMPAGEPYEDEFFGRMEIYRGDAEVRIPIERRDPGIGVLELELRSQGCADIGLCYPPQTWTTRVELPAAAPVANRKMDRFLSARPGSGSADAPLPPGEAFSLSAEATDAFSAELRWLIADGYYLYRDSLKVHAKTDRAQARLARIPPGEPKYDEHFGNTLVFHDELEVAVAIARATPEAMTLPLSIEYQGCKEDSICYPVQVVDVDVALPAGSATDRLRPMSGSGEAMVSEQDRLSALIIDGRLALVLATFTGLGLLLAFTPCVLPMVPILSGIIAGQGKDVTTGRAFALSLTYVLGMALTYTAAGAGFAAAGNQIQAALQKPWIIAGVAALFIALALSMFGLYELRMPAALQNRLTAAGNRQKAGTFVGTAILGALSALVVTTCVAPPLVASLTVIATAGDVFRGAASLFALSIGMGIPLLVVGTSAGRLLPGAGAWMNAVKTFFGFLMLGLAIWMLDRVLPGVVTMVLWAVLAVTAAIWLGAFDRLVPPVPATRRLGKAAGLLAALYGAALFIGALSGAENPLQPLEWRGAGKQHSGIEFTRIKTVGDLERAVAEAGSSGRFVMLDFYADWCVSCKEMESYTFTDDRVITALDGVVLLQADVTANDDADRALLQHFGIFGPPTIVFFDNRGRELEGFRVVGFMSAADFTEHVRRAFGAPKPT